MTAHWDAYVNTYFPVGDTRKRVDGVTGHRSRSLAEYESVGDGFDWQVGYTLSQLGSIKGIRLYFGGYYFDIKHAGDVTGGLTGINIPMSNFLALQLDDSYDNSDHNSFLASLVLTLGGSDNASNLNIHDRLLDQIPRALSTTRSGMAISLEDKTVRE